MKHIIQAAQFACCLLLLLVLSGCGDTSREPAVANAVEPVAVEQASAEEIRQAKNAISTFAVALKAELTSAMQQGGPLNAIEVCNTRAILIREQVSEDQGLQLSRVSMRNRNPDNAPLNWQRPVLESFEQLREAGGDPNELEWSEIATIAGRRQFRYMKAIPAGGLCLQCHGQSIAQDVSEVLTALYPQDRATGFSEGDIRGAFVVTRDL